MICLSNTLFNYLFQFDPAVTTTIVTSIATTATTNFASLLLVVTSLDR